MLLKRAETKIIEERIWYTMENKVLETSRKFWDVMERADEGRDARDC